MAVGVGLEDLAHELGPLLVDLDPRPVGAWHASISEADPAGGHASLHLALQASVCLVAEVVQVDLVDKAPHAAMELAGAALRVVPVGHAQDADAAVLEAPHDRLLLDQVARKAIKALEDQGFDSAGEGVGEQRGAASTSGDRCGAGSPFVLMDNDHLPPARFCCGTAYPRLVVYRGFALLFGAESGVDGGTHGVLLLTFSRARAARNRIKASRAAL